MVGWLLVIHVIAAAFWFGSAIMMLYFVVPAIRRAGGFNAGVMSSSTGMLLSWGALAGIVAFICGQLALRAAPPRNTLYLRITAALIVVAFCCMIIAVHG